MANIKIIAVGKLQKMYLPVQEEFLKRLSRYAKTELIEVADEQAPEKLSDAQKHEVMYAEWERISKKLCENDFVIALDSTGETMTSMQLASSIEKWQENKNIVFIIGGSLGFAPEALKRANAVLSLSKLTFTHSMARQILLEAIYRSYKIIKNEPYHK